MALDEALLGAAPRMGRAVLRFYGWSEPAATFGYSQRWQTVTELTRLRPLIRRPTGGGLVSHERDWTYSLVFPATHPWYQLKALASYQRVHEWLRRSFAACGLAAELSPVCRAEAPGQCFLGAEQYDLLYLNAKIAGAAQRRTRDGLLIQGSVQPAAVALDRPRWEEAMMTVAHVEWGVSWELFSPDEALQRQAEQLARETYARPDYNRKQ
jgi:lipoate-protein ligase A